MKIVTMNSVYEVDEEKKLVRRAENTKHVYDHPLATEEWQPYLRFAVGLDGGRAVFTMPDGGLVLTSTVTDVIEDVVDDS